MSDIGPTAYAFNRSQPSRRRAAPTLAIVSPPPPSPANSPNGLEIRKNEGITHEAL